ncbi:MAG: hypothetical protein LBL47_02115, partial [Lactobacillus sp.]|nr:hypothetical protein [Lactobacillus sp.]
IAEGSVEDVFSHLPKSVIDEEGIINVVENNYGVKTELTIKPLSIKQGKYEFVFGGLEYWSADNFDVINCEKFLRYQKRLPKKAPAPKPKTQRKSRKAPYFVSAQVQELA